MNKSENLRLRKIGELRNIHLSGWGTSPSDCMSESTFYALLDSGVKVGNLYVCGLGYVGNEFTIEGSGRGSGYGSGWDEGSGSGSGSGSGWDPWGSGSGSGSGSGNESNNNSDGGNGNSGPAPIPLEKPSPQVNAIAKSVNLSAEGIRQLNRIMKDLLNSCSYRSLYNNLASNGIKINEISIDPKQSDPGAYNSYTNKMTFHSNATIYGAFTEEFLHFFQHNHYSGGLTQYMNRPGHANIEFEAKLMQDILYTITPEGSYQYHVLNADSRYGDEYLKWLDIITDDRTRMPNYNDLLEKRSPNMNLNYINFIKEFVVNKPGYKTKIDETLAPAAINFLHNSGCNGK